MIHTYLSNNLSPISTTNRPCDLDIIGLPARTAFSLIIVYTMPSQEDDLLASVSSFAPQPRTRLLALCLSLRTVQCRAINKGFRIPKRKLRDIPAPVFDAQYTRNLRASKCAIYQHQVRC